MTRREAVKAFKLSRTTLGRMRFMLAPSTAECLQMITDIEKHFGGEAGAAALIGPSRVTLRSWKHYQKMSVPSKRMITFAWTFLFHPERLQAPVDLVTWGRWKLHHPDPPKAAEPAPPTPPDPPN